MSSDKFFSYQEAVDLVRQHFGASVGRTQALVKEARASGEVREGADRAGNPALFFLNDEGLLDFNARPGAAKKGRPPAEDVFFSEADLRDWISRKTGPPTVGTATKPKPSRRQDKRARARFAIAALWPKAVPASAALPNAALCQQVGEWLRQDSKKLGLTYVEVGSDTILRAAGRK